MEQEQNEKQEIAQSATVELTTADGKKKKIKDSKYYVSTRKICYVALFTALNIRRYARFPFPADICT